MIEFELEEASAGWKFSGIPDNLVVIVRTSDTKHRMQTSLRDLLLLYDTVLKNKEESIVTGTGHTIKLVEDGDFVMFNKYPLSIRTTYDQLQSALEPLLGEVFEVQDAKSTTDERKRSMQELNNTLQSKNSEIDIIELYKKLISK